MKRTFSIDREGTLVVKVELEIEGKKEVTEWPVFCHHNGDRIFCGIRCPLFQFNTIEENIYTEFRCIPVDKNNHYSEVQLNYEQEITIGKVKDKKK
jgi:hypothetical protein